MTKKILSITIFLLLLLILIFSFLIERGILYNIYQTFLTAGLFIQISVSILLIFIIASVIYICYRFKVQERILNIYSFDMNGLIILEAGYKLQGDRVFSEEFKDSMSELQTRYDYLQFNIDYSTKKVKIEVKTPGDITVRDGNRVIQDYVDDLNHLMDLAPSENVLINININGVLCNLKEKIKFVIVNNGRKVGIKENRYKKGFLGGLFYANK